MSVTSGNTLSMNNTQTDMNATYCSNGSMAMRTSMRLSEANITANSSQMRALSALAPPPVAKQVAAQSLAKPDNTKPKPTMPKLEKLSPKPKPTTPKLEKEGTAGSNVSKSLLPILKEDTPNTAAAKKKKSVRMSTPADAAPYHFSATVLRMDR